MSQLLFPTTINLYMISYHRRKCKNSVDDSNTVALVWSRFYECYLQTQYSFIFHNRLVSIVLCKSKLNLFGSIGYECVFLNKYSTSKEAWLHSNIWQCIVRTICGKNWAHNPTWHLPRHKNIWLVRPNNANHDEPLWGLTELNLKKIQNNFLVLIAFKASRENQVILNFLIIVSV